MHKQRQPAASRPSNPPIQARKQAVNSVPRPLDEAALKRVVGGTNTSPPGPNGNW